MPDLPARYIADFNSSLSLVAATETLWLTAPPASVVRQQLKVPQREALYEAAFLRVFCSYENFLEDVMAHFMAKYATTGYSPVPSVGGQLYGSVKAATAALYGGRPYILWHGVGKVVKRCATHLHGCPVESVLLANQQTLEDYARIRHRIAHNSLDAVSEFTAAANRITGNSHRGSPGGLLRAPDISDPMNQPKWIRRIVDNLADVVLQICA